MPNNSLSLSVGNSGQMGPYNVDMCTTTFGECGGSYSGTAGWGANWSSSNTSVASIPSPYDNAEVSISAQSAGSTQITASGLPMTQTDPYTGEPWSCYPDPQTGNVTVGCPSLSISVSRSNLTSTSATGSPANVAATPAFTYTAVGSGAIASYTTSNANANPNTAAINGQSNAGAPKPGGLGAFTATYTCKSGATTSKSFSVPTFGLSCYFLALQSDWGSAPNSCQSTTIYGESYSGASTNPSGMPAGTYCNAFLGQLRLQGSGSTNSGAKVHYVSGDYPSWTFLVISSFTGADGTALIPNGSVARDRTVVPRNTTVQLPAGSYVANDIGQAITGYRLDVFMGTGVSACSGFINNVVVGACSPAVTSCPGQTIQ